MSKCYLGCNVSESHGSNSDTDKELSGAYLGGIDIFNPGLEIPLKKFQLV